MRFLFWTLPLTLIRILFYLAVFLTPVLGVWIASSLVAYINGPILLAVGSGILLFPLVPLLWDLRGRGQRSKTGVLTWGDRITLRTLVLNLMFIACLLALRPQLGFLALSTRGDWMLDGQQGPQVEWVRQGLFTIANRLEWLYLAFHDNPHKEYADTLVRPTIQPTPSPRPTDSSTLPPKDSIPPSPSAPSTLLPTDSSTPSSANSSTQWPWTEVGLHPSVANMPVSVETSIESVAQYLAQQESDPMLLVKALHDYVADRVAYDAPSYFAGRYPPQDAETVFQRRLAVCAGYAKLLEALGKAAGAEIIYVVGDARSQTSDLSGQGHAWNAAQINGSWYLIDATWDSGYIDHSGFTKKYKTDYLFPPPEVMAISHFPDDLAWQLMAQPLTRGEFFRQPMIRPQFFADGLTLVSPKRSQTDITGDAMIELQNPRAKWLMASYVAKNNQQAQRCADQTSQATQISCPLPGSGTYDIKLFSGDEQYGQYAYIGQLEFNRR